MAYVLNLVYLAALTLLSPWLAYRAIAQGRYREGFAEKLWGAVPARTSDRIGVWLHAVSVGEVNLLLPLVTEIQRRRPGWDCVISSTTMTGFALAKSKFPNHQVFYCPFDFSWATRRAMRRIRPKLLVLAELELWPNLIRAAHEAGAQVAVVNGRLSQRSFRGYHRFRPFFKSLFHQVDLIAAQNEEYAERFRQVGADPARVRVTGSIKFDGAQSDRSNPLTQELGRLARFQPSDVVWLVGSTQAPEEELALDVFRQLVPRHPQLRLVLVPRHPHRFDAVAELCQASGLRWQRRSRIEREGADPQARVLLVDTVGELLGWWGTAHIAFVGGSLSTRGGQNMIEPAAYGAAVSFGPNTRNFRDVVAQLLAADGAVVVADGPELAAFVERCLVDPDYRLVLGTRAQNLVRGQVGATARTVDLLTALPAVATGTSPRREAA